MDKNGPCNLKEFTEKGISLYSLARSRRPHALSQIDRPCFQAFSHSIFDLSLKFLESFLAASMNYVRSFFIFPLQCWETTTNRDKWLWWVDLAEPDDRSANVLPQISPPIKYQDGLTTLFTPKICKTIALKWRDWRGQLPIIKSTVLARSRAVDRGNNILIVFVGTGTSKFGRNCIKLTSKTTTSLSAPSRSLESCGTKRSSRRRELCWQSKSCM